MKRLISLLVVLVFLLPLCSCGEQEKPDTSVRPGDEISSDWETAFSEAGFSEEEITSYKEVLDTIGVSDYHDVDVIENGAMHIVRGKIYDSDNLQLNVTLENRSIIYVELAGIPDQKTEAYINWRGKLKTKTVDTITAVELYSDTEGGYLAVLDWDTKTVSEYEN